MRIKGFGRFAALILGLALTMALAGCGENIFSPVASSDGGSSDGGSSGGGGSGGGSGGTPSTTISAPTQLTPEPGASFYAANVTISWNPSQINGSNYSTEEVIGYELKLGRDSNFTDDLEPYKTTSDSAVSFTTTMEYTLNVSNATQYAGDWYWKVRAIPAVPTRARTWTSALKFTVDTIEMSTPKGSASDVPSNVFALVSSRDNIGLPETAIYTTGTEIKVLDGGLEIPNGVGTLDNGVGKGRYESGYYELIHTPFDSSILNVVIMIDGSAKIVNDETTLRNMVVEVSNFYRLLENRGNFEFSVYLTRSASDTTEYVPVITSSIPSVLRNPDLLEERIKRYIVPNTATSLWSSMLLGAEMLAGDKSYYFQEYYLANLIPGETRVNDKLEWAGALVLFTDAAADTGGGSTPEDVKLALDGSGSSAYVVVLDNGLASDETLAGLKAITGKPGLKVAGDGISFVNSSLYDATALAPVADTSLSIINGVGSISLGTAGSFYEIDGGTPIALNGTNAGASIYTSAYLNGNRMVFLGSDQIFERAGLSSDNMAFARNAVAWAAQQSNLSGLTVAVFPPEQAKDTSDLAGLKTGLQTDSAMGSVSVIEFSTSTLENANVLIVHASPYLMTRTEVDAIFKWAMGNEKRGVIFSGYNYPDPSSLSPLLEPAVGDGYFGFDGNTDSANDLTVLEGDMAFTPVNLTLGAVNDTIAAPAINSVDGGGRIAVAPNGITAIGAWNNTSSVANPRRTILIGTREVLNYATATNANGAFSKEAVKWLYSGSVSGAVDPTKILVVGDGAELSGFLAAVGCTTGNVTSGVITDTTLSNKKVLVIHDRTMPNPSTDPQEVIDNPFVANPFSSDEIKAIANWMRTKGGTLMVSGFIDDSIARLVTGQDAQALADKLSGGAHTVSDAFLSIGDALNASALRYFEFLYCSPRRDGEQAVTIETKTLGGVPGSLQFDYDSTGFLDYYQDNDSKFRLSCYDRMEAYKSARYDADGDGFYSVAGEGHDPNDDPSVGMNFPAYPKEIDSVNNATGAAEPDGIIDASVTGLYTLMIDETVNECYPDKVKVGEIEYSLPTDDSAFSVELKLDVANSTNSGNAGGKAFSGRFYMNSIFAWTGEMGKISRPILWNIKGELLASGDVNAVIYPEGYPEPEVSINHLANVAYSSWIAFAGKYTVDSQGRYVVSYNTLQNYYNRGLFKDKIDDDLSLCDFSGVWTLTPVP